MDMAQRECVGVGSRYRGRYPSSHSPSVHSGSSSNSAFPELKKEGDSDWVLNAKIGDLPVAVIVVGKVE